MGDQNGNRRVAGYQGDGDDEIEMQALQTRVLVPERSMVRAGRFGVPQTGAGYNVTPQLTAVTILPGGDVPARADVQVSLFSILLENLQCGVVGITRCLETCFPVREPEDRTGVGAAVAEFVIDMQPHARVDPDRIQEYTNFIEASRRRDAQMEAYLSRQATYVAANTPIATDIPRVRGPNVQYVSRPTATIFQFGNRVRSMSGVVVGRDTDNGGEAGGSASAALDNVAEEGEGHEAAVAEGGGSSRPVLYPGVLYSTEKSFTNSDADSEPEPAVAAFPGGATDASVGGLRVRGQLVGSGPLGGSGNIAGGNSMFVPRTSHRISVPSIPARDATPDQIAESHSRIGNWLLQTIAVADGGGSRTNGATEAPAAAAAAAATTTTVHADPAEPIQRDQAMGTGLGPRRTIHRHRRQKKATGLYEAGSSRAAIDTRNETRGGFGGSASSGGGGQPAGGHGGGGGEGADMGQKIVKTGRRNDGE